MGVTNRQKTNVERQNIEMTKRRRDKRIKDKQLTICLDFFLRFDFRRFVP